MGDTVEWCHYADYQRHSARGPTPGRPRAGAVSSSQATTEVDGLLREPRPQRSSHLLALRRQPTDLLSLAAVQRSAIAPASPAGASIYPAVQNLMVAARALGLGTTITTLHREHEAEVKELLGIPDDVETMALIPVGRPRGRFGPGLRRPVEQVTYWDRWGEGRGR